MSSLSRHFNNDLPLITQEDKLRLTVMVMKLFDHWSLDSKSQLQLLGLSEKSRALLVLYRQGKRAIGFEHDRADRIGILLDIHKNLRLLFPENKSLVYDWVNRRNKMLNNVTPLEVMLEHGLFGMAKILRYLDFQLVH